MIRLVCRSHRLCTIRVVGFRLLHDSYLVGYLPMNCEDGRDVVGDSVGDCCAY